MAAGKPRKLKVFQAPFGFYESVVAAPSKVAALRAWGSHQDLFAQGFAQVAIDQEAIKAALASPEIPLRRAVGSNDPFELESRSLPSFPSEPSAAKIQGGKIEPAARRRQPDRPPPDRTRLDAAEAALSEIEGDRKREEDRFTSRLEELQAEQAVAQKSFVERKRAAIAAIDIARRTYEGR